MADREYTGKVSIDNVWADSSGVQWCFIYIDGQPWLGCEEDVK